MAKAPFDVFRAELDFFKDVRVGLEADESAIGLVGFALFLIFDFALFESGFDELALAMAANEEILGEGVYGFGADSVEADTELEDVVVVFGAGVNLRDAIHDFAEGDAASEIADGDGLFLDGDMDLFACAPYGLIISIYSKR